MGVNGVTIFNGPFAIFGRGVRCTIIVIFGWGFVSGGCANCFWAIVYDVGGDAFDNGKFVGGEGHLVCWGAGHRGYGRCFGRHVLFRVGCASPGGSLTVFVTGSGWFYISSKWGRLALRSQLGRID